MFRLCITLMPSQLYIHAQMVTVQLNIYIHIHIHVGFPNVSTDDFNSPDFPHQRDTGFFWLDHSTEKKRRFNISNELSSFFLNNKNLSASRNNSYCSIKNAPVLRRPIQPSNQAYTLKYLCKYIYIYVCIHSCKHSQRHVPKPLGPKSSDAAFGCFVFRV